MIRRGKDSMSDDDILIMYKKGYSINYIAKRYYKYKNKKHKAIKIEGMMYFAPKVYNMEYCKMYVSEIIFKYCTGKYFSSEIA